MNNILQIYSSIKNEQKPIIQFIELKKIDSISNYFKRYASLIVSLLIGLLFYPKESFLEKVCVLDILAFIICFINFLLWKNILQSFRYSKIYYEESSWFDLKIWNKPSFLIKNDKIFENYKVKLKLRKFWRIGKNLLMILVFLFMIVYFIK